MLLCQTSQLLTGGNKTSKGHPHSFVEILWFCSAYLVWSRLQCVQTSSLPRVASVCFRYCDQAGRLVDLGPGAPWREERTVAAFVCRWKGLQVLTAMINHPEADIWIQPGKRFNFLIHPAHNLFTPAVGTAFPHLPPLSSRWPLPHAVFLPHLRLV